MLIKINFNNNILIFNEWEEIKYLLYEPHPQLRRTAFNNTYVEWIPNSIKDKTYWYRNFQGRDEGTGLYSLNYIYDQMYPGKLIDINQQEEAKNHMDEFLVKYNSLKVFL